MSTVDMIAVEASELKRLADVERAYLALTSKQTSGGGTSKASPSVPAGNLRKTFPGWTVGRRIAVGLGFPVMIIATLMVGLTFLGMAIEASQGAPKPAGHVSQVTRTGPAVACPHGTLNGQKGQPVVWLTDSGACSGTVTVNGVTMSYVRNADGTTLLTWSYGSQVGNAGYDTGNGPDSSAGYFANVDN